MKLATYIKKHKLSQAEMARRIGVDQATVCRWLAGSSQPRLPAILWVQNVTGGLVTVTDWGVTRTPKKKKEG